MSVGPPLSAIHVFQGELLATCLAEILPLAKAHFAETARFTGGGCNPDISVFERIEAAGNLRIFTVRHHRSRELLGYCVMVIRRHHHCEQIRATEDLLYIAPKDRGIGRTFVNWIDEQLARMGAEVVYRAVQVTHDHGEMFHRLGYQPAEMVWAKPLVKPDA